MPESEILNELHRMTARAERAEMQRDALKEAASASLRLSGYSVDNSNEAEDVLAATLESIRQASEAVR